MYFPWVDVGTMSVSAIATLYARGGLADVDVLFGDDPPIQMEVAADLTGATVTYTLFGDTAVVLTAPADLTVQVGTGLEKDSTGTWVETAKAGYSLIELRALTLPEWEKLRPGSASGCEKDRRTVAYELRYTLSNGRSFTPWAGHWLIERRAG